MPGLCLLMYLGLRGGSPFIACLLEVFDLSLLTSLQLWHYLRTAAPALLTRQSRAYFRVITRLDNALSVT
jgi:hypothetical protein